MKSELSRVLCRLLRHEADKYELEMTKDGFVLLSEVLKLRHVKAAYQRDDISMEVIQEIVDGSDKERFTLKENNEGHKVTRANQGHSLQAVDIQELSVQEVKLGDQQGMVCVHGTFWEHVSTIIEEGLWSAGVK